MELEILTLLISVPIAILIPTPRFQCRSLQMASHMAIDNYESYYNNLLLENLDNSVPAVRTTETPIRPIPEKNASKSSSSGISTLEKFMDRKYDEAALNQLKQELLSEIKQHIDKMENNDYLSDYIKSSRSNSVTKK